MLTYMRFREIIRKNVNIACHKKRVSQVLTPTVIYMAILLLTRSQCPDAYFPPQAQPGPLVDIAQIPPGLNGKLATADNPLGWHCEGGNDCHTLKASFSKKLRNSLLREPEISEFLNEEALFDGLKRRKIAIGLSISKVFPLSFSILNPFSPPEKKMEASSLPSGEECRFPSSICRPLIPVIDGSLFLQGALQNSTINPFVAKRFPLDETFVNGLDDARMRLGIPVYISLLFGNIFMNLLVDIMTEKEGKLDILLKVHGIGSQLYFVSWIATYLCFYGLFTAFPVFLTLSFANVFPSIPYILTFSAVGLYFVNVVVLSCLFSLFFESLRNAMNVAGVASLTLELLPIPFMLGGRSTLLQTCLGLLLPSLPFYRLCERFIFLEVRKSQNNEIFGDGILWVYLSSLMLSCIIFLLLCFLLERRFRKGEAGTISRTRERTQDFEEYVCFLLNI